MGAGRTGTVIEIAADARRMRMAVRVLMGMIMAGRMGVIVRMRRAVGVGMRMIVMVVIVCLAMRMGMAVVVIMRVRGAVGMRVGVGMMGMVVLAAMAVRVMVVVCMGVHRAIGVHMFVHVTFPFDFHFTRCATTNRTHVSSPFLFVCADARIDARFYTRHYSISISRTRISVPPVA
jgi:hypothetical protein